MLAKEEKRYKQNYQIKISLAQAKTPPMSLSSYYFSLIFTAITPLTETKCLHSSLQTIVYRYKVQLLSQHHIGNDHINHGRWNTKSRSNINLLKSAHIILSDI